MPKSLSKTPAPKKDRIFGSDKNKKGSASSKASAKGIDLNDSIIETLSNKAKEYNEKHPNSKVSVTTLKAVMRRGMGAYSTSHRPTITGGAPNSRQAWGFARVNKFLKKKAGQEVKAAYVQDDDLMAKGGQTGQAITCVNCGWHWNTADSDEFDKYICHKCGFDNRTFYDPEPVGKMADGGQVFTENEGLYVIIKNVNEENRYKGAYKKIFDIIEDGVSLYNPYGTDYEKIIDGNKHIFITPRPEPDVIEKIEKIPNVKVLHEKKYMADGGLIAPNGKKSNLTPEQYKLVRTPEFKAWFGDWENDPENASKVVDENGEPLVVYHGTYVKEKFNNFDFNKADLGFHFGTYEQANDRSQTKIGIKDYKQFIEPFFLNIRKLFVINDAIEFEYPQKYIGDLLQRNIITEKDINENGLKGLTIKQSNEIIRNLLVEKYNNVGFKYQNQIEAAGNSYIVCEPNQIKLADGTNTTFDAANPDIRYADGGLIAPNGKPSNLSPEQYKLVRTPEFKAWFGDWENDSENASKVVDENGEPLVVYHGTEYKFNEFDINKSKFGFFFTNSYDLALTYDKNVYQFFLDIKKPRKKDFKGANHDGDYQLKDYSVRNIGYDTKTFASISHPNTGYNGAIMKNVMDIGEGGWNENLKPSNIYVVFKSNQIKLADGTNTTFDAANPDIRYADGGQTAQELFKPSKTIEQIAKEKDVPLDYAEEQLRKGMKTESEHSDNPMVQETIALQHLDEMIDYYEKLEYIENQNKMAQGDLLNNSLFNKALIYKSIKPIREANEMMERLDFIESQNKMANGGVTKFYKEYLDWYIDGVYDKMTIMVSVPNAFSKMSGGDNDVILDVFEKKDENVDAKKKLTELLEIVDRNGLDVYLEPIPRLYNIKDKAKRDKITREYLIKYYENFGFELLPNGFMVRKHNNMEKGGYYKAGGEINPDNKSVKDYFSHGSGNVGGVLVGKRHSEGGIKAVNKSTNQPLEMEGGEVVITRNAVSDNTKREFNGEMLTNREILSKINESGGGVSFADGGDIPETISTSGKEYKYGGKMMKDHEIVSSCGCNHSMAKGGETKSVKIDKVIKELQPLIKEEKLLREKMSSGNYTWDDVEWKELVQKREVVQKKAIDIITNSLDVKEGQLYKYNKIDDSGTYFVEINKIKGDILEFIKYKKRNASLDKLDETQLDKIYGLQTNNDLFDALDFLEMFRNLVLLKDDKLIWENYQYVFKSEKENKNKIEEKEKIDKKELAKDWMKYVKDNIGYFQIGIEYEDTIELNTRKNASIASEEYSQKDFDYAKNIVKKVKEKYPNTKSRIYTIDEWVEIELTFVPNNKMAEGGETDYHTEIKNHLFPKVEVEVEVEVEPEMEEMPIHEHYITADDLGLSEGMPMLAVGTIVYSSGGNDQWEVVSFSDDGVNLVNNPKSPLQSKMEDKHLTFEELIKYFKDKAISIKNISTERELEPAIALVKNKLPQKSFAVGGLLDGDEDEDAKLMQSQFGKSNFK